MIEGMILFAFAGTVASLLGRIISGWLIRRECGPTLRAAEEWKGVPLARAIGKGPVGLAAAIEEEAEGD